jgi:hypothetical protein
MSIFNKLCDRLDCPALKSLSGRVFVNKTGLFLAHFVTSSLPFAFPTFLGIAPRLALLELLAMSLVFTTYCDDFESATQDGGTGAES